MNPPPLLHKMLQSAFLSLFLASITKSHVLPRWLRALCCEYPSRVLRCRTSDAKNTQRSGRVLLLRRRRTSSRRRRLLPAHLRQKATTASAVQSNLRFASGNQQEQARHADQLQKYIRFTRGPPPHHWRGRQGGTVHGQQERKEG